VRAKLDTTMPTIIEDPVFTQKTCIEPESNANCILKMIREQTAKLKRPRGTYLMMYWS
jgi:hypothetical protein